MNEQKRKILNYRPMCVLALAMIGGIILGESMFGLNVLFRLIPLLLLVCVFLAFVIVKKTRKFAYIILAIAVGFMGICASNDVYENETKIGKYSGYMTAKVSSEITTEWDSDKGKYAISFFVEDVYAGDTKLKLDGYVTLSSEDETDFFAGDIIRIYGDLNAYEHKAFDSFHAYDVARKEGYRIYASTVEKLKDGKLRPLERVPYKIRQNFYSRLDDDTAGICSALILGDKRGIDEGLYTNIAASGLAHVLAVSGLHISLLSSALYLILKKCKVNAKVSLIAVLLLTLMYCFFCGFTASSLRALIMTAVLNFASAFGKKGDALSSMSLAAAIILLVRPTALFEAGFLMSFSAVLGIVCYYKSFHKVGVKIIEKTSPKRHIGTWLSRSVSLSLSTNLGTYPFVAFFFEKIPVLFLLSNVIVLPYLMFIYAILLINTVFSLIVGWSGNLILFKYLLYPFRLYVTAIGTLSFATIPVTISVVGIILFLFLLLLMSRFIFLRRGEKLFVAIIACTFSLVITAVVSLANASNADADIYAQATMTAVNLLNSP